MTVSGTGAGDRGGASGGHLHVLASPMSGGGANNGPSDETSGLQPRSETPVDEIVITFRMARYAGETWYEAALRHARSNSLPSQVDDTVSALTNDYHSYILLGHTEQSAAFAACCDNDVLDVVDLNPDVFYQGDHGPSPSSNERPAEGKKST